MGKTYKIGDRVASFSVVDARYLKDFSSNGILLRHPSGMEVLYLENQDSECFFSYSVYTPPTSSKGVFHILEHTLLAGSEKYRVRDPFMMMERNSANTFLNALTGPDRTYFPAASPVKRDFDNIFSVYTDAIFRPLLRKESFEQEGIRLSSKPEMHFEGVVFSEMQGDVSSHDAVVASLSTRPLFDEDSPYRYEFGGNPPDITDLTYEEFIDTYKRHYTPSNISLFLYGNLDLEEKLDFLEREYLSSIPWGRRIERAKPTTRWDSPRRVRGESNADEDSVSSSLMLSFLLSETDNTEECIELSLMVDILLGNPGSPLYKGLVDSNIGRDLSEESGMTDAYRELVFSVGVSGSSEDRADEFENYTLGLLEKIAEEGIGERAIEAALRRMEFSLREKASGVSKGYSLYFSFIDRAWAFGKNPMDSLEISDYINAIRLKLKNNPHYFEDWIREKLLNNPHRLLSVIVMDKDHQKKIDKILMEKLEEHRRDWSEEDERNFIRFSHSSDKKSDVMNLPRLTVDDVPNASADIKGVESGIISYTPLSSGGIVYIDIAFDVSDLSFEEIEDLSLLSRLMLMTDTKDLSMSDFQTELSFSTGGITSFVDSGTDVEGNAKAYFMVRTKALKEHLDEALRLLWSLLFDTILTDQAKIKNTLEDINSDFQSSIMRNAHQFALSSSSASVNRGDAIGERIKGIEFWYRSCDMLSELESLPQRLERVRDTALDKKRMRVQVGLDESLLESVLPRIEKFVDSIPSGAGFKRDTKVYTLQRRNLFYSLSSPVVFMGLTSRSPKIDDIDYPSLNMFFRLVAKNTMWSLIREKGGAYGVGTIADSLDETFSVYTYRDPRIDGSYSDILRSFKEERITKDKIDDLKLSVLSRDIRPMSPQGLSYTSFIRGLFGVNDERRHSLKERYLKVSVDSLESVRERLLGIVESSSITVIGDSRAFDESAISADKKRLPIK